jgi:hypothetical protein
MRFEFYTLIDITETRARFSKTDPVWHQQQNYLTFVQTLGLRVNTIIDKVESKMIDITDLGFGSKYKGSQQVWTGLFYIEYEHGLSEEILVNDFNLVPVINNLQETITLKDCVFDTKNKQSKNTIFKCVD